MSGLRYSKAPRWVCKAPFDGAIPSTVAQYPSPKHSAIPASLELRGGLIPPVVFPASARPERLAGNGTGRAEAARRGFVSERPPSPTPPGRCRRQREV